MLASIRSSLSLLSRRERATYYFLIACKVLSSFLDLLGIASIGVLVGLASTTLTPDRPLVVLGLEFPTPTSGTLAALAVFVLALFVAKGILAILLSRRLSRFLAHLDGVNAQRIADSFLHGNLNDVQKYSREGLNWAVLESTTSAFSATLLNYSTVISETSLLLFIGGMFFLVNPLATVFTLAYFAILIGLMEAIVGRMSARAGKKYSHGVQATSGSLNDIQNTFREISVFQRQAYFSDRVATARTEVAEGFGMMKLLQTMPRYIVETALMVGVVGFVGWQFLSGGLQDGGAVIGIFLAGGVRIMGSALPLQNALASLKNQLGQSRQAQEILNSIRESGLADKGAGDEGADDKNSGQFGPLSASALGVVLEDVDFSYPGSTRPALRSVSLVVEPGQHVAIIGPSGAGKTTLVDMILGLLPPTAGKVSIAGTSPSHLNRVRPGIISYVPQRPGIVAGTIAENIALGVAPEDIDFARIAEVVSMAFLDEFVSGVAGGVNAPVGAQLSALSGGQIQRLGLARALYPRPQLLILDEATSALDAGSESVVAQSLKELGTDVTVIVVAHRLSTVQHSDNVFVLEDGAIVASGTFKHLRKTVPLIEEYVTLMSFDDQ
jgi:ATP-binding cassette subfamily C protein